MGCFSGLLSWCWAAQGDKGPRAACCMGWRSCTQRWGRESTLQWVFAMTTTQPIVCNSELHFRLPFKPLAAAVDSRCFRLGGIAGSEHLGLDHRIWLYWKDPGSIWFHSSCHGLGTPQQLWQPRAHPWPWTPPGKGTSSTSPPSG